jgi:hypothetical protein
VILILSQLNPPNRTAASHKANVTEPIIKPAFDHTDLSLKRTKRVTANITGGPYTIRNPARIPNRKPQPKPGIFSNCGMAKTQGDRDR